MAVWALFACGSDSKPQDQAQENQDPVEQKAPPLSEDKADIQDDENTYLALMWFSEDQRPSFQTVGAAHADRPSIDLSKIAHPATHAVLDFGPPSCVNGAGERLSDNPDYLATLAKIQESKESRAVVNRYLEIGKEEIYDLSPELDRIFYDFRQSPYRAQTPSTFAEELGCARYLVAVKDNAHAVLDNPKRGQVGLAYIVVFKDSDGDQRLVASVDGNLAGDDVIVSGDSTHIVVYTKDINPALIEYFAAQETFADPRDLSDGFQIANVRCGKGRSQIEFPATGSINFSKASASKQCPAVEWSN